MKKPSNKTPAPPLEVADDSKLVEQLTIRLTRRERQMINKRAAAWNRKPGPYARLILLHVWSYPQLEQAIMGRPRPQEPRDKANSHNS